MICYKQIIPIL